MSDIYGRRSGPIEEPQTIFIEELLISCSEGIFIPKFFVESIKRPDYVPEWAWENCLKGPGGCEDEADYWDSWSEILDTFEYEKTGPGGSTERYFLDYDDGDLCLMREIVEPPDYNDE